MIRTAGRVVLGAFLVFAGVAHFTATQEFVAQVPPFLPAPELIVYASGVVEIALGAALIALPRHRVVLGWLAAAFFVAILPGNVSQAVTGTPAFGLDSDAARWGRLVFQPVLVAWALWSTGAWRAWRTGRDRSDVPTSEAGPGQTSPSGPSRSSS